MRKVNWKVSLKSLISIKWEKHLPRLVLHEKYEKKVKWTLRILASSGILSSIVAFPVWYMGLSLAVLLFLIEQFFERAIFQYTSIYMQPMPDFKYDPDEWKAMSYAFPQDPDPRMLNVVGCTFRTSDYARKFFTLLKSWNYDQTGLFDVSCGLEQYGDGSGDEVDDGDEGLGVSISPSPGPGGLEQSVEAFESG